MEINHAKQYLLTVILLLCTTFTQGQNISTKSLKNEGNLYLLTERIYDAFHLYLYGYTRETANGLPLNQCVTIMVDDEFHLLSDHKHFAETGALKNKGRIVPVDELKLLDATNVETITVEYGKPFIYLYGVQPDACMVVITMKK